MLFVSCCSTAGCGAARAVDLPADTTVRRDETRGTLRWAQGKDLGSGLDDVPAVRAARAAHEAGALVLAVLDERRGSLGLATPAQELRVERVEPAADGGTRVRLAQVYRGIPVDGSELSVQLDAARRITVLSGSYVKTPSAVAVEPQIDAANAVKAAANAAGATEKKLTGVATPLVWYPNDAGQVRLAYRIHIDADLVRREDVFVDASTAEILARRPTSMPVGSGFGGVVGP